MFFGRKSSITIGIIFLIAIVLIIADCKTTTADEAYEAMEYGRKLSIIEEIIY